MWDRYRMILRSEGSRVRSAAMAATPINSPRRRPLGSQACAATVQFASRAAADLQGVQHLQHTLSARIAA